MYEYTLKEWGETQFAIGIRMGFCIDTVELIKKVKTTQRRIVRLVLSGTGYVLLRFVFTPENDDVILDLFDEGLSSSYLITNIQ